MIAIGRPPGKCQAAHFCKDLGPMLRVPLGGTSRFPQTPSTGPLARTNASRLPAAAREEAEQREHEDDDEDDPENAHAFSCLPLDGVDLHGVDLRSAATANGLRSR